jgi:O-antigen/teichoic acid export membrane protein
MKILKNSLIYSIVSVLQKAVSFLLLPLYTSFLSKAEYGVISVVQSIINLLSIVFIMALNASLTRFYYDHSYDKEYVRELIGTIVLFVLIVSIALSVFLILTQSFILSVLVKDIDFFPYLLLGILSTSFLPLYLMYQNLLQTKQEGRKYGINATIYFIITTALTVFFVVGLQLKAIGFLLAITITNFVFFVQSLVSLGRMMKFRINRSILGAALRYSLPIVPHTVSSWVFTMIDRIFLNNLKNQDTAGLYSVGYQFGNLVNITASSVNQAYVPWFYDKMSAPEPNNLVKIISMAEYVTVFYTLLSIFISFFGKEILSIMVSKDFREAWEIIPFISFAYVLSGLYYLFINSLFYSKKHTKLVSLVSLFSAASNIVLNIMLIPTLGMVGSSIASFLTNFILSLAAFVLMWVFCRIKFHTVRMYMIAMAGFGLSFFMLRIKFVASPFDLLVKSITFLLIVIAVLIRYKRVIGMLKEILFKRESPV